MSLSARYIVLLQLYSYMSCELLATTTTWKKVFRQKTLFASFSLQYMRTYLLWYRHLSSARLHWSNIAFIFKPYSASLILDIPSSGDNLRPYKFSTSNKKAANGAEVPRYRQHYVEQPQTSPCVSQRISNFWDVLKSNLIGFYPSLLVNSFPYYWQQYLSP